MNYITRLFCRWSWKTGDKTIADILWPLDKKKPSRAGVVFYLSQSRPVPALTNGVILLGLQVNAEWCLKWCADEDHRLLEKSRGLLGQTAKNACM